MISSDTNHAIITGAKSSEKSRLNYYLGTSSEVFTPAIRMQNNTSVELLMLIRPEDRVLIAQRLRIDFHPVFDMASRAGKVIGESYSIQTSHDLDDWMSEDYVAQMQQKYSENIFEISILIIHAQPHRVDYIPETLPHFALEFLSHRMTSNYDEHRNSMFFSLCQSNVTQRVFERQHLKMHEVAPNVFKLCDGLVKWIMHGENLTIKNNGVSFTRSKCSSSQADWPNLEDCNENRYQ